MYVSMKVFRLSLPPFIEAKNDYCRPSDFQTTAPAFSMIAKYFADARPKDFADRFSTSHERFYLIFPFKLIYIKVPLSYCLTINIPLYIKCLPFFIYAGDSANDLSFIAVAHTNPITNLQSSYSSLLLPFFRIYVIKSVVSQSKQQQSNLRHNLQSNP